MDRKDDVIELGVASVETKGGTGLVYDMISGRGTLGLTED